MTAHICIYVLQIIAECRITDSAILQFWTNYFNQIIPCMHICSAEYNRMLNCNSAQIFLAKLAHIWISVLQIIATNYFGQISPYMHICSADYSRMQNCRFCNSARIILAILAHICISVLHIIAEFRIADSAILQFCTNYFDQISSIYAYLLCRL